MLTKRKIQDKITKELKPDCSFDEFCKTNGIEFTSEPCAPKKTVGWKKIFFPIFATAAIALCVGLPFAFKKDTVNPVIDTYGDAQVSYETISSSTLLDDTNLILFDLNKCESYSFIRRMYPIENNDLTVGYSISDVIYGLEYEGNLYAYEFDYFVRCYSGYQFSNVDLYSNPESFFSYENTKFGYTVDENDMVGSAFVSFKSGDYDYYVSLRGFEDITEINSDSVEIFIKYVLSN